MSTPEISVTVYPSSIAQHVSQIYTGLIDLHYERKIRLCFSDKLTTSLPELHEHVLCAEISTGAVTKPKLICFDMRDGGQTVSEDIAEISEIYFKRSFDAEYVQQLPDTISNKIHPYGLNYACRSNHLRNTFKIHFLYHKIQRRLTYNPLTSTVHIGRHLASLLLSSRLGLHAGTLHLPADFEVPPQHAAEEKILFLTRAWDPGTRTPEVVKQFIALNDMRANTIRMLKHQFGDRFIGGLKRTPYAVQHYPDCIATHNTGKDNYLSLVKRCLIAVTTTGLHGSTGWKLPEYLAASRCIVSEPLIYALPTPLIERRNLLTFATPEDCVSACNYILENPSFAQEMRANNHEYYNTEIKPSALLLNRLSDTERPR